MTMHKLTINEILTPKPDARPRIYAYSIADEDHGDPPLAELHRPFLDRCPDIPLVLVSRSHETGDVVDKDDLDGFCPCMLD